MKAILVIDEMPKNCEECPCCYGFACPPLDREMGMWMIKYGKPLDCPLKPMPDRKEEGYPIDDYAIGKADGWNACLYEITGETE